MSAGLFRLLKRDEQETPYVHAATAVAVAQVYSSGGGFVNREADRAEEAAIKAGAQPQPQPPTPSTPPQQQKSPSSSPSFIRRTASAAQQLSPLRRRSSASMRAISLSQNWMGRLWTWSASAFASSHEHRNLR